MDSAIAVVEKAKALGVTMTPVADKIRLKPASKVPPELTQAIRQHKNEIMAILTSQGSEGRPLSLPSAQIDHLMRWAGSDPKRWKRLHTALLHIYSRRWECGDTRDTLVTWTAARQALAEAEPALARLKSLRPPLKYSELISKVGRQADVDFWGRLASRLEASAAAALCEDAEAAGMLAAFLDGNEGVEEP